MMKRYNPSYSDHKVLEHPQGEYVKYSDMPQWLNAKSLPEFNDRPQRLFVCLDGTRYRNGIYWKRRHTGEAWVNKNGFLGLDQDDFHRLCENGDMDPESAVLTYWMPYSSLPNPPEETDDD